MDKQVLIVQSKADIKKGVDRTFTVTPQANGSYEFVDNTNGKTKNVSEITFKKSYKVVEGEQPPMPPLNPTDELGIKQVEMEPCNLGELPKLKAEVTEELCVGFMPPPIDLTPFMSTSHAVVRRKKVDDGKFYVAVLADAKYTLMDIVTGDQIPMTVSNFNRNFVEVDVNGKPQPVDYYRIRNTDNYTEDALPDAFQRETGGNSAVYNGSMGASESGNNVNGGASANTAVDTVDGGNQRDSTGIGAQTPNEGAVEGEQQTAKSKTEIKPWSLMPKYDNPEGPKKPLLQSQGLETLENDNSMRANRESKADGKPFTPIGGNFKIRQSMLSNYLQCPSKFYKTYEEGYSEDSIFTRVGTAIHGVMEDYYNDPQNTDVEASFEKWWRDHADADPAWYKEWREHVINYFKRMGDARPTIIALEFEWETEIAGIMCSGTIDRIDRIDDKTIRIVDYKTNFTTFTTEELESSVQFKFYTLALQNLKHIVGDFEVVECQYEMLRLGISQSVSYDEETLEEFKRWLAMINDKILAGRDRAPRLNKYCGYCQMRDKCPLYEDMVTTPTPQVWTDILNVEDIANQRELLQALKKVIEGRLTEVDGIIKEQILRDGGETQIGEHIWSMKAGTRQVYDTQKVIQTLALLGKGDIIPNIVSVSSTALKHHLKDSKEVLTILEAGRDTTYISPSLNKKKIKPAKK